MPIYAYRCSNQECRKEFEYFHATSADKVPKCPHCGGTFAKKLPTAASNVVNGASAKNNYGLKKG